MSEHIKPKRRYTSTRRQAQAAETRRQIIAAARKLFVKLGYAGTTVEDIAREAGIAVQTIYATFGSKLAILKRLVELPLGAMKNPCLFCSGQGRRSCDRRPTSSASYGSLRMASRRLWLG